MNIYVIDGGWGNLTKLKQFFSMFGNVIFIRERNDIKTGGCLVVPGVGNFGYVAEYLQNNFGLDFFSNWIKNEKLVGICSGMQALCASSTESDQIGINLYSYQFVRLSRLNLGWNHIRNQENEDCEDRYYFAHRFASIYTDTSDRSMINLTTAITLNNEKVISSIRQKNVLLTQFHVELSEAPGRTLVRNFLCV